MKGLVNILMATYNGELYIKDQIESILSQTYQNWHLLIRDDGSTDNTLAIAENYVKKDSRIKILFDSKGNLNCCQNFSTLLENVKENARYVMFCDQDDAWLPDKIELSLNGIIKAETHFGENTPVLLYTKFAYADEHLNPINIKSKNGNYKNDQNYLPLILAQNFIYGCTTIINSALVKRSLPIPVISENHDYWISLVAAYNGEIVFLNKITMFYRQHKTNLSGNYTNNTFFKRMSRIINERSKLFDTISNRILLVKELEKYIDEGNPQKGDLVRSYLKFMRKGAYSRVLFCFQNKIKKPTHSSTFLFYLLLFIKKPIL